MKNTFYAIISATLAMFATSGIVALATAAPSAPRAAHSAMQDAEAQLVAHLDTLIAAQLHDIKGQLFAPRGPQ